jgi:beta-glucanase (GH16 family)
MSAAKRRNNTNQESTPQRTWKLAFQDEFDGSSLNEQIWETQFPWGRDRSSVGELQWYAPDAFKVANSKLQISAQETETPNPSLRYSSGLISTHKSFATEFGRFEIRCKLPRGKGLWPAFWLLPPDTSWPPEIDVFEALGDSPETVHMTSHWSDNGEHRSSGAEYTGPDFSDGFHTFAMEWSATSIVWFVDGVQRHKVENHSPRGPMYLLANMAVGGDWPGAPDATTAFPAAFEIDYIRAFKSEPAPSATPAKEKKNKADKNKNKDKKRKKKKRKGRRAVPKMTNP